MRRVRRLIWILAVLVLAAGIGFWMRPLSFFDGSMYLREVLTGVESREVPVHGHRVHYLTEGPARGPAVVLVHGLGGRAEDWIDLAPYLAKAGFRVYMPDLLGYGRSEQPADFSYSVRDEAGVVIGFMDALDLQQVDLGGWSMGGWVAQIVTSEAPQRVQRLMLFDSAGLDTAPVWDTRLFTPTTARELDQLDALLMPHPPQVPGFVVRAILRFSRHRAWVVQRAMASMLTGADVTDALLPKFKMPVLIAWGAEDHIIPIEQAQKMHRLVPQSELDTFAGCGHLAPLQCAGDVGPKVVAFVKR
ncbi:MAG TPA: alpha/beta fold hydrolase [Terracidiphilus sp.]|jgi:pimeloyl-ACP methyl ester carboxylesterase|nr:alpha/beta fold hydrolase [Terracidiphilus sp.]